MQRQLQRTFWTLALATPLRIYAQYCIPQTAIPYASSMPGLTLVQVNTINRTSQDIEDYPDNSYVNTGLSTTMAKGQSYPITLGFTIDAGISPHMNLRIWVDLNQDGQLDDPGETLYTIDHVATTQTGTITIPAGAMTGTTRMRVTAKMCSHGGHSLPTPCDQPPDILGYHGEIEDYEVNIVNVVGIEETAIPGFTASIAPNPATLASTLTFFTEAPMSLRAEVTDLAGRVVANLPLAGDQAAGEHIVPLARALEGLGAGAYLLDLTAGEARTVLRFTVAAP